MIHNMTSRESWLHPLALERRIQILSSVLGNGNPSPADLARSLDCTRAESSRHVKVLLQKKFLEKPKSGTSKNALAKPQGRPGQALRLAPRFSCAVAYLLSDEVELEFLGDRLETVGLEKITGWKTQGELLRALRQKAAENLSPDHPLYFCVDGLVMPDLLVSWEGMPEWKPLSTSRQKETGQWQPGGALTFTGALAMGSELENDLFVLHWTAGLKIAHRSNGKLVLGARGTSTPIGHRELRESGNLCRCGRTNCLESLLEKPDAIAMDLVVSAVRKHLGKKCGATSLLWSGAWENAAAKKWGDFASVEFPDPGLIQKDVHRGAQKLVAENLFRWELKRETA
ncbi:MAG: ROK family transcriptional regulator [Spirochaetia bacterium]|nr:ROK family transcriptional regulator [Spirochaetia bacterium]